jgi:hypothetical protein
VFGGEILASPGRPRGWLDLPAGQARALGASLEAWAEEHVGGRGLMICVSEHTDYTKMDRATWGRPLGAAVIEVAGCQVLGIRWDEGDHAMLHRGERERGSVYPVTLEPDGAGGTVLRWTILPDKLTALPESGEPGLRRPAALPSRSVDGSARPGATARRTSCPGDPRRSVSCTADTEEFPKLCPTDHATDCVTSARFVLSIS